MTHFTPYVRRTLAFQVTNAFFDDPVAIEEVCYRISCCFNVEAAWIADEGTCVNVFTTIGNMFHVDIGYWLTIDDHSCEPGGCFRKRDSVEMGNCWATASGEDGPVSTEDGGDSA